MGADAERFADDKVPRELAFADLAHLAASYGQHFAASTGFGLDLPYGSLGGPGFERLCYHLLLAQGRQPRFFGRPGDAQYGIDLVVSDGAHCSVYQCKNSPRYTAANLRADLDLFAQKWLIERPHLPRPERFILCCTAKLSDRDDWETAKTAFFSEHRVTVEEWQHDSIDIWLRAQPDIVADLFGDDVAERFCDRANWNDGLFRPLLLGSGEKDVERYLHLRAADRLVHDPATVTRFREIITENRLVLIEGLSGSGKTMAALDLTASLDSGAWRVFFVSFRNGPNENQLVEGIKNRCVRPTLFVLDDCHRDFATVERIVSRVRYALRRRAFALALTAQTAPGDSERVDTEPTEFLDDCRQQELTITIAPGLEQYREIVARTRPALATLPPDSIKRLYTMTAHNLAVLDLLLNTAEDRTLADAELLPVLFPRVLRHYFGHERVHAPALKALAAVAQYDIAVPMGLLPRPFETPENQSAVEQLTLRIGAPTREQPTSLTFIHASAAELLFRAISWADADPSWVTSAAQAIILHLLSVPSSKTFTRDLELFVRGELRLEKDYAVKHAVLIDPAMLARFSDQLEALPIRLLNSATLLTCGVQAKNPYVGWLVKRLTAIIRTPDLKQEEKLAVLIQSQHVLKMADPAAHLDLAAQLGERMLRLIGARGTIMELLRLLQNCTPESAATLIAALDSQIITNVVDKTIAEGRSIGTLNLHLRELTHREIPSHQSRLVALEEQLGIVPVLRLIRALGTISDLLLIIRYSSEAFGAKLIAELDRSMVAELIDRTITESRSIGTLSVLWRELAKRKMPDGSSQLVALSALFDRDQVLRLVRAQGTIVELLQTLTGGTPASAAELIAALDPLAIAELVDKAIAEHRSIGTLDLHLRALEQRKMPDGRSHLTALEARFDIDQMLRLIHARGTICDLLQIARTSTPGYATELIAALDPPAVSALIDRAIAEGRSIGTLGLTLRRIRKTIPDSHAQLEDHIGVEGIWRLVLSNGDLNDLAYLLDDLTPSLNRMVLAPDAAPDVAGWMTLVRRGGFYSVARFARDSIDMLPAETLARVDTAVAQTLGEVVEYSSWKNFASGLAFVEQTKNESWRNSLQTAALAYINRQNPELLIFRDFINSASGLFCLWQKRKVLRPELGRRFWSLLPAERDWPEDYSLFLGGQFLLEISCSEHVGELDAQRLLRGFSKLSSAVKIEHTRPRPLFLFLWNLFALWQMRGRSEGQRFSDLQAEDFWARLERRLPELAVKSRLNEDKLEILALAGVLALLLPDRRNQLMQAVRGKVRGIPWLVEEAARLTFVPAVLAFNGLALIAPYNAMFSPDRRRRLLAKADEYEERGSGIEFLCDWLRRDNARHPWRHGRTRRGKPMHP